MFVERAPSVALFVRVGACYCILNQVRKGYIGRVAAVLTLGRQMSLSNSSKCPGLASFPFSGGGSKWVLSSHPIANPASFRMDKNGAAHRNRSSAGYSCLPSPSTTTIAVIRFVNAGSTGTPCLRVVESTSVRIAPTLTERNSNFEVATCSCIFSSELLNDQGSWVRESSARDSRCTQPPNRRRGRRQKQTVPLRPIVLRSVSI